MLTLGSPETKYSGTHLTFLEIPVTLENGEVHQYEYVVRNKVAGIVAVLPVTKEKEIILIKQFRIPLQKWQIETPAWLIDKAWESAEVSARRELLEETGYEAWELEFVYRAATSAGLTNEEIDCFIAHDCFLSDKKWELDAIEQIETFKIPAHEVYAFLQDQAKSGILIESKVYWLIGLYTQKYKGN